MDRKPGFFSSIKEEVVRGLSPRRGRSQSPSGSGLRRGRSGGPHEIFIPRSGSFRAGLETLSPLREGPDPDGSESWNPRTDRWAHWLCRVPSISASGSGYSRSDLRLVLGVLGAPLAPVHVTNGEPFPHLCIKGIPIECSSAQYILQQYLAASGGLQKLRSSSIQNSYAMGKMKMMTSELQTGTKVMIKNRSSGKQFHSGGFVLWQMNPDMWYVELAVAGSKVHAGCNGKLVWRHTPWLGPHAAKGPVRPLRRALQGLDPWTTANMFVHAQCMGEKEINGEDCFVLKLCADNHTVKVRSEGPAEIIRHVLFGYFSQRTGLLVQIEDSHLTRIQNNGGEPVYWETTISSFLDDYRAVEGIMIAHSGRSVATLLRFGETAMNHTKTRMEEFWTIEEVEFNVPGLSMDCFIPPAEVRLGEHPREHGMKNDVGAAPYRAKIASLG